MIRAFNLTVWRSKSFESLFLGFVALIFVPFVIAQDSAPTGPAIRVTSRHVEVAVIVQDDHGEPITGLTKDDFELFDQGKPQPIADFSALSESESITPTTEAAAVRAPTPVNVYSNRSSIDGAGQGHVSVILLDKINTGTLEMSFARARIIKFLNEMHAGDTVGIYSFGREFEVIHDFSSDTNALIASVEAASGSKKHPKNGGSPTLVTATSATDSSVEENRRGLVSDRAATTADALVQIANNLAGLHGRKSLIWISSAFPEFVWQRGSRVSFESTVTRVTRALTDANVAVYPVDPRGLPSAIENPGPYGKVNPRHPPMILKDLPDEDYAMMDTIADLTGGKASYHTNDIEGSIRRAIDDSRVTYMLGYYPDHAQWDGEFREIKVRIHRQGAQLHYRRGYFAVKDAGPGDEKQRAQIMLAAVSQPLESTSLGVKMELLSHEASQAQPVKGRLTIDLRDVKLNSSGARRTGSINLFYVELDPNRKVLASHAQTLTLSLTDATYKLTMRDGAKILCDFPIKPGATTIRVVALDANSGATGTVTIPLAALLPKSAAN